MIVTVTMNPALDKTAEVSRLRPHELNRLENVRIDAGGKGINVSKMIAVLGGSSVCTGFVGGNTGQELCQRIDELGIEHDFIQANGITRTNLKVLDGGLTELNEPGISVTQQELDALLDKTLVLAGKDGIVILSGSLPMGADPGTYEHFTHVLKANGCKVIVDADGESLQRALQAKPNMVKPNRYELLKLCNAPQDTPQHELPNICMPYVNDGIDLFTVSMGEDGAMFFAKDKAMRADTVQVDVRSTVGAGDSMVGAFAFSLTNGYGFEETIRLGMACSIGAVTTEGTNPPALECVEELKKQIIISDI